MWGKRADVCEVIFHGGLPFLRRTSTSTSTSSLIFVSPEKRSRKINIKRQKGGIRQRGGGPPKSINFRPFFSCLFRTREMDCPVPRYFFFLKFYLLSISFPFFRSSYTAVHQFLIFLPTPDFPPFSLSFPCWNKRTVLTGRGEIFLFRRPLAFGKLMPALPFPHLCKLTFHNKTPNSHASVTLYGGGRRQRWRWS